MRRFAGLIGAAGVVGAAVALAFILQPIRPLGERSSVRVDDREPLTVKLGGFTCGKERWAVKTLADPAATSIDFATVTRTNIPALVGLPTDQPSVREAPVETTVYQLTGTRIVSFKLEGDSDIHLVLRSPLPGNPTMIAELPDLGCVTPATPLGVRAEQARMGLARAAFLAYLQAHGLTVETTFQTVNIRATLTGVGMFDFNHGQTGVAPNAVELHPVLSFQAG